MQRDDLRLRSLAGQQSRRARVQLGALRAAHVLVDRGPDERMRERERLARREDRRARERIQHRPDLLAVDAGEAARADRRGVLAEHGDRAAQRERAGIDAPDAQQQRRRDPLRGEAAHRGGVGDARHAAVALQLLDRLDDQERVPAARLVQRAGDPVRARVAGELRDRGPAQRARPQHRRARLEHEGAQQIGVERRVAAAGREAERDRQPVEPRRQMEEETDRRRIGPVHVVHGHEQRRLLREVRDEPVEAVQDGVGRPAAGVRRRGCEHRLGEPRRAIVQASALLGAGAGQHRLEELAHHAEAEVALELPAAGAQDEHPVRRSLRARSLEQPRLADARRTLHERHAPAPGRAVLRQDLQRLQLALALEQRGR